jgi:hypothetical protein
MNRVAFLVLLLLATGARSDEIAPRALDVEFAAAVEEVVARCQVPGASGPSPELATGNSKLATFLDALDADRYSDRARAGARLLALCQTDPTAQLRLLRARAVERRPEARYWLNRILRDLNRCAMCAGAGYCSEYRPTAGEQPAYSGLPCRQCRRFEWQHGLQWIEGTYSYLACSDCHGSGTHWNHYAVD